MVYTFVTSEPLVSFCSSASSLNKPTFYCTQYAASSGK